MPYASQQDLVDRFGSDEILQLTDRSNLGSIDTTVVARALADADAQINGYLAARYTLPLAETPPMLTRLACDIARYQLYDNHLTEAVSQRYKDAVRVLVALSNGSVNLGAGSGQAPAASCGSVAITAADRVFSASLLSDY